MSLLPPEAYETFSRENANLFNDILDLLVLLAEATAISARISTYKKLTKQLSELEQAAIQFGMLQVQDWSIDQKRTFGQQLGRLVREKFTAKVLAIANSFRLGRVPSNFGIGSGVYFLKQLTSSQQLKLKEAIKKSPIVTLSGPKFRKYSLDYYLSLLLHSEIGALQRDHAISESSRKGSDLVQVSTQPSIIGDYCDLYRGRVFSVTGKNPDFPPLSDCPNGGAPFHPWCRHYFIPIEEGSEAAEAAKQLPPIPPEFIAAARTGASPNEFMKLWNSYKNTP